jgi:transglutaminase-like putative cysteine protease
VTARDEEAYVFYEDSVVALAMFGVAQTLRTALTAETDDGFALRRFSFTLTSPATTFAARGTSDGKTLAVTYGVAGQEADLEIPLEEPIRLPSTLRPWILAGDRSPGTRYTVPVFSPLTLGNEPMTVVIEGREGVPGAGGPVETLRLSEEHRGIRTSVWLDDDGAVVREQAALGFTLEREPRDRAIAGVETHAPVDLVAQSRIPLVGTIPAPRDAARLALKVSGSARTTIPEELPRQRLAEDLLRIAREPLPAVPPPLDPALARHPADLAPYLAPAPLVESDDPGVAEQAREVAGDATDALTAAQRLVAWVHAEIAKEPSVTVPSARAVLAARRGDCNEHAVLLTAMARSIGLPARVVAGVVYANDGFYYHAWTELWLGSWISADAVFGQLPVDATHVKLLDGGPERHGALIGTIGHLAFEVEGVSS